MIWASNEYLAQCASLSFDRIGRSPAPGDLVGRGFADLGYEAFHVLPAQQLLSLFTGNKSKIAEDFAANFFLVPDVDTILSELSKLGVNVEEIKALEGAAWRVRAKCATSDVIESTDRTLLQSLLGLLLMVIE